MAADVESKRLPSFKDSRLRIDLLLTALRLFLQRIALLRSCGSRVDFAFRSLLTRTVARRYVCLFHKHLYLRFNTPTRKLRTKQTEKPSEYFLFYYFIIWNRQSHDRMNIASIYPKCSFTASSRQTFTAAESTFAVILML